MIKSDFYLQVFIRTMIIAIQSFEILYCKNTIACCLIGDSDVGYTVMLVTELRFW